MVEQALLAFNATGLGRLLTLVGLVLEFLSVGLIARRAYRSKEERINDMVEDPKDGPVGDARVRMRERKDTTRTLLLLGAGMFLQALGLFL